ncbi:MAG: CpsD/CapB family tyrosine-protein kinase [Acutalibacteraceae bacterium]|nr:CpsD/CapB family tyrosine-protein kinase [Acutalibacteraceae bacterium]
MDEKLNNFGDLTAADIQFAVAESYKSIRTNLQFLFSSNPGCKIIAISSPQAGEGKSTNAINLAIAFSQLGKKVLLIDADLRRPSLYKKLRIANTDGLSGILAGFATVEDNIVTVNNSFDTLPSGAIPPNPSELLSSASFQRLLASMRLIYDYIIIDTPPAGIVSDALSIANETDGLLLVVKEKSTTHADLQKVLDNISLAGVRILGAILNSSVSESQYSTYKSVY